MVPITKIPARRGQRHPKVVKRPTLNRSSPATSRKKAHGWENIRFALKSPIHIPTDVIFFFSHPSIPTHLYPCCWNILSERGLSIFDCATRSLVRVYFEVYNSTYCNNCQGSSKGIPVLLLPLPASHNRLRFISSDHSPTTHLYHRLHILYLLAFGTSSL